jgi:hypothetical protein
MDVVETEPADCILMQGDEVAIEFDKALDFAEPQTEPVPEPSAPLAQESFDALIPVAPVVPVPAGHTLGGVSRPVGPDGKRWNPWRA